MKQKIYILGIVTVLIIFAGTVFKVNHWPLAGFMLVIGLVTLVLVFLPVAFFLAYIPPPKIMHISDKRQKDSKIRLITQLGRN